MDGPPEVGDLELALWCCLGFGGLGGVVWGVGVREVGRLVWMGGVGGEVWEDGDRST